VFLVSVALDGIGLIALAARGTLYMDVAGIGLVVHTVFHWVFMEWNGAFWELGLCIYSSSAFGFVSSLRDILVMINYSTQVLNLKHSYLYHKLAHFPAIDSSNHASFHSHKGYVPTCTCLLYYHPVQVNP